MYVRNAHGDYKMPVPTFRGEKCSVKYCSEDGTDRAHVRKCNSSGVLINNRVYVIPMCMTHNRSKSDEPFEVKPETEFFPIDE